MARKGKSANLRKNKRQQNIFTDDQSSSHCYSKTLLRSFSKDWTIPEFDKLIAIEAANSSQTSNLATYYNKVIASSDYFFGYYDNEDGKEKKIKFQMTIVCESNHFKVENLKLLLNHCEKDFPDNISLIFSFRSSGDSENSQYEIITSFAHGSSEGDYGYFDKFEEEVPQNVSVKITCNVSMYCRAPLAIARPLKKISLKRQSLSEFMEEQWIKKSRTDVNLICKGETFPCFSQFVATQSDVLRKMLDDKRNGIKGIKIDDMDIETCRAFVTFLHSDKFDDSQKEELLYASEKYKVSRLKIACEEALINSLSNKTILSSIKQAKENSANNLKAACLDWISVNKNSFKTLKGSDEYNAMKEKDKDLFMEMIEYCL